MEIRMLYRQGKNEFAIKSEGKQAKGKHFFLPGPLYRLLLEDVAQI